MDTMSTTVPQAVHVQYYMLLVMWSVFIFHVTVVNSKAPPYAYSVRASLCSSAAAAAARYIVQATDGFVLGGSWPHGIVCVIRLHKQVVFMLFWRIQCLLLACKPQKTKEKMKKEAEG